MESIIATARGNKEPTYKEVMKRVRQNSASLSLRRPQPAKTRKPNDETNRMMIDRRWEDNFEQATEEPPFSVAVACYVFLAFLYMVGLFNDMLRSIGLMSNAHKEPVTKGFVALYRDFENFYRRNFYARICYCWNNAICSLPGAQVQMMKRSFTHRNDFYSYTGETSTLINFGSYNYLGFAQNDGTCTHDVEQTTLDVGLGVCSSRHELGNHQMHADLESLVAEFVSQDAAMVFGMGFATNSMNMPALMGPGCLLISDDLNHASLVLGSRLANCAIRKYRHNDMEELESVLQKAIVSGQPKTHKPWKKILIVVEGIYSMEGTIVKLPDIVRLKRKYKAYVYLDEAHSIGAVGERGRGIVEYFRSSGVRPSDIDICMGTFTKSFGSCGGYIAGSHQLINYIRSKSHSACYATSMSPTILQQTISSMKSIMETQEGKERLERLKWNTHYFRNALQRMGYIVYGNQDSPVVPILLGVPGKIGLFWRETQKRGLAVCVVGFPAVPIAEPRARLCLSSAHTKEMLDEALRVLQEVCTLLSLNYAKPDAKPRRSFTDQITKCSNCVDSSRYSFINTTTKTVCEKHDINRNSITQQS